MPFSWDSDLARFRDARGRLVPEQTIRRTLDQIIDAQAQSMRDTTQGLLTGTIMLADWQLQMMASVKALHLVATAVAHGGWNQLDQSDFGWAGQRIRAQYGFLRDFAAEIASGKQAVNGVVVARIALYAQSARATNREAQRRIARSRELDEERRVLGVADHCRTCLQQAKLGWQPFGTLRRIGDSECRVACRCHYEFRAAA